MLALSPRRIRALRNAGLVAAARGTERELRFSFTDLVVLRTARDLIDAGVPFQRVRSALSRLKEQLPRGRTLTGVRIVADGHRVVVRDGSARWDAESRQALLDFELPESPERVAPLTPRLEGAASAAGGALAARDWFELGCELEMTHPDEAVEAYRRALRLEPMHTDAHVNLGRLLHETGAVEAAEDHYRAALAERPSDITALFNLGVALEDMGRLREARAIYREALLADPDHADAHFNLAGVLERMGQKGDALKHLKAYRQLIAERGWDTDDLNV